MRGRLLTGRASQIFRYEDHTTSLARALAWFGNWPRNGIQLDNFLECGPFRRMDASHLCHSPLCVLPSHIVYESSDDNQSRRCCQERARFLRADGRPVPQHCRQHSPPCLLQVGPGYALQASPDIPCSVPYLRPSSVPHVRKMSC